VRVLFIALLIVGCEGERVVSSTSDAGTETATAECEEIAGNVVPNWSFEEVAGENVASWTEPRLTPASGDADHCQRYAKLIDAPAWGGVSERIPIDAEAGATLEYGMSLQVLDGEYADVGLFLVSPDDTQVSRPLRAMPRDRKWVRVSGSLKLTAPVTEMIIGFGTDVPKPRSLAVDRVWLVKR